MFAALMCICSGSSVRLAYEAEGEARPVGENEGQGRLKGFPVGRETRRLRSSTQRVPSQGEDEESRKQRIQIISSSRIRPSAEARRGARVVEIAEPPLPLSTSLPLPSFTSLLPTLSKHQPHFLPFPLRAASTCPLLLLPRLRPRPVLLLLITKQHPALESLTPSSSGSPTSLQTPSFTRSRS